MNNIIVKGNLVSPSKVVCIGRNYVAHIQELNNELPEQAVIFVKPNSAISSEIFSTGDDIIHYEGEISFVIEKGEISAVGFGLDLTKRAVQSRLKAQGLPWERAKAFDSSAVFSEFVGFSGNIDALSLRLFINGQLTQQAETALMIWKPLQIIEEVTAFMSFADGDILMTGTPQGVGPLCPGDKFVAQIFDGGTLLIEQHWQVN